MSLSPVEIDRLADAVADRVAVKLAAQSDPDGLMDVHGAAAFYACSVPTVERLTAAGEIPSLKVGRLRRYSRAALIEKSNKKGGCDHGE